MATLDTITIEIDTSEAKQKLLELHELADALQAKFDKLNGMQVAQEVKISMRADDLIAALRLQDYRSARTS